jgi:hypothetical protein
VGDILRRLALWLFGAKPDPGPLFPPREPSTTDRDRPLAARHEREDRMMQEIDQQLKRARAHLQQAADRDHAGQS